MVAAAHASLAAYLKFRDCDEVREWLAGPFRKVVCKVSAEDFEKAKAVPNHALLIESALDGQEVAIAFKPREGEDCIQAVRFKLRAREVVALTDYDRLPVAHVTFSRRNIFKRDHYACQYCGAQPGSEELTIDHVVPRAQGGVSSWENCVLACMACNKRKADRTPEQARMRVRKKLNVSMVQGIASDPPKVQIQVQVLVETLE